MNKTKAKYFIYFDPPRIKLKMEKKQKRPSLFFQSSTINKTGKISYFLHLSKIKDNKGIAELKMRKRIKLVWSYSCTIFTPRRERKRGRRKDISKNLSTSLGRPILNARNDS